MLLKAKRNYICGLFAILLLVVLTVPAAASDVDVSYRLSPLPMSVKLPGNDLVITRQTEENSPLYEKLGLDAVQTQDRMTEENLYLLGFPADQSYEIDVEMTENGQSKEIHNLKFLSERQLAAFEQRLLEEQNSANGSITETPQALFFDFETRTALQNGERIHTVTAYTIVNGQQILLRMQSEGDDISVEELGVFHNMVNSVTFSRIVEKPLDVNMGAVLLAAFVVVLVLAVVFALIIFFRTKKRIRTNGEACVHPQPHSGNSPMDDFYDELQKDGLFNGRTPVPAQSVTSVDVRENEPQDQVFKNKPLRVEVEVAVEKEATKNAEPQKHGRETALEEERDSVELSRSNNEDYDEAVAEENLQKSSKLRIFVGRAGSKAKNSVSSVGGVWKYKKEETIEENKSAPHIKPRPKRKRQCSSMPYSRKENGQKQCIQSYRRMKLYRLLKPTATGINTGREGSLCNDGQYTDKKCTGRGPVFGSGPGNAYFDKRRYSAGAWYGRTDSRHSIRSRRIGCRARPGGYACAPARTRLYAKGGYFFRMPGGSGRRGDKSACHAEHQSHGGRRPDGALYFRQSKKCKRTCICGCQRYKRA